MLGDLSMSTAITLLVAAMITVCVVSFAIGWWARGTQIDMDAIDECRNPRDVIRHR